MRWIWPDGLEPLWNDQPEEDEGYYKSILEEIENRYAALPDEERNKLLDTNRAGEIDRGVASATAKNFLSKNRNSLVSNFMNGPLVSSILSGISDEKDKNRKKRAIRAWLAQQLGRDDLGKVSPMENELVKYYSDSRGGSLGSLPPEARAFIRRVAPVELLAKTALNSIGNGKSRETQGYNSLLAVDSIENSEIAAKERELESLLLANLSSGRGNVLDVTGGEVRVPGFDNPSSWKGGVSLEDSVLNLLADKFKTSQFANGLAQDDGWKETQTYSAQVAHDQALKGGAPVGGFQGINANHERVKYDIGRGKMLTENKIARFDDAEESVEQYLQQLVDKHRQEKKDEADREEREKSIQEGQEAISAQRRQEEQYDARDNFLRNLVPAYEEVIASSGVETNNPNGSPLPEDWADVYEYPVAVPYKGGMLVAVEDGDAPRYISGKDKKYKKYKGAMLSTLRRMVEGVSGTASQDDLDRLGKIIELLENDVSDSRMKKRKRKGVTKVGRLGSFLSSGMFRIGG